MLLSAIALAVSMAVMFRATSISVPTSQLVGIAVGAVLPAAVAAAYCHWCGYWRLREGSLTVAWAGLLTQLLIFPMYAAARLNFPLRDGLLADIDKRLGLEVPAVLSWLNHQQTLNWVLSHSYDALFPMILVAVTVPAMAGRLTAAKEFVVANLVATVIAIPASALVPAIGPWVSYHFTPNADQIECTEMLRVLRQPGAFQINMQYSSGLITFPSFHVILAIISSAALCCFRTLRLVAVVLCVLIVASAVSTGWHYIIDVLGGIIFAAISIGAAKAFTRIEARLSVRTSAVHDQNLDYELV